MEEKIYKIAFDYKKKHLTNFDFMKLLAKLKKEIKNCDGKLVVKVLKQLSIM